MVSFCPRCGAGMQDGDEMFCPECGNPLTQPQAAARGGSNAVRAMAVVLIVVLAAAGAAVAAVGGSTSFKIDYDEDSYIAVNTSKGVFERFEWTVADENGIKGVYPVERGMRADLVLPNPEEGSYMRITLTAYSILGIQWSVSEEWTEDGIRRYSVDMDGGVRIDVEVAVSDFIDYKNHTFAARPGPGVDPRWPGESVNGPLVKEFMTTDSVHGTFENVVQQLRSKAGGTREEQVNFIMRFVQSLDGNGTYKSDRPDQGDPDRPYDHWSFPLETLYRKGGDCEDLSMLFLALCGLFFDDEETALVLFWDEERGGHAMAGMVMPSPPSVAGPVSYEQDGRTYYACELTARGWKVGRADSGYTTPSKIIAVP